MIRNYKNTKALKAADDLVLEVYRLTRSFPSEESEGLTLRLRQTAISAAAHIVRGAGRSGKKDFLADLLSARGDFSELDYLLDLAGRLNCFLAHDYRSAQRFQQEAETALDELIQSVETEVCIAEPETARAEGGAFRSA